MDGVKVYQAIAEITGELAKAGIAKDKKNVQQGYAFRGIDDVYFALSPLLAKHKLCVLPRVMSREVIERTTQKGAALFYTILTVEFDFVSAEDGSRHTVCTIGEAMDSGDKSTNKAQSAAYKYACLEVFCIPTEAAEDAERVTHEVAAANGKPQPSSLQKAEQAIRGTKDITTLDKYMKAAKAKFPEDDYLYLAEIANAQQDKFEPAAV